MPGSYPCINNRYNPARHAEISFARLASRIMVIGRLADIAKIILGWGFRQAKTVDTPIEYSICIRLIRLYHPLNIGWPVEATQ